MKYVVGIFLGMVFFGTCIPSASFAFQLSPAVISESILPGKTVVKTIQVKNPDTRPIDLFLTIQKFVADGDTGRQKFLPPADIAGLPEWVRVSTPQIHLDAGAEKAVSVRIAVPKDVSPGAQHAAIFFTEKTQAEGAVQQGMRIGSLLLITVPGGRSASLEMTSMYIERTHAGRPISIRIGVKNTGGEDASLTGRVVVKARAGAGTEILSLDEKKIHVLAQTERRIQFPIDAKWWWMGWQTVHVEINGLPASSVSFFVWSWGLVFLFVGSALLGTAALIYRWRARSSKQEQM
jgi:hypothetical protein